ncbi:MAG: DUF1501 domain-containing protein [Lentisphaeria bacterium]|nr:DUF1501 domain-containing protein [Lentisphaeria bacterium]
MYRSWVMLAGLVLTWFWGCGAAADTERAGRRPARSVIEIWVWGGPSQLETFDPKPAADKAYNNGLGAIPTNVPGIAIGEMLPKLAQQADKYSIIRTMTHPHRGHETATYLMQTGREPGGGKVYPAIGAVIAMFKSRDYQGDIPPYVILTIPKGRFSEIGFLSEQYAPLVTGGNPSQAKFMVDGMVPPGGLTPSENAKRFELLDALDNFGRGAAPGLPVLQEFHQAGVQARKVIEGDAAKVFDLSLESDGMRDRYGRNQVGQSCLAARRLVQAGVPYITINAQGWDSHKRHFETMKQRTAEMDQAVATLLQDLHEQGLLETTIVWWTGEFGRGPKIDWEAPWNGGRNHYSKCFSAMVAGGGFAGGRVVGESDAVAGEVVNRPVAPQDMLGSIYELCGIDPDGPLPNPIGLETTVLPPESPAGRLRELYR